LDNVATIKVLLDGGGWLAKHPSGFALKFRAKEAAEVYARLLASHIRPSVLIVYGRSGEVELRESFEMES
jgi:hypothetical protein